MEPTADPCYLLKAQLTILLHERLKLLWSKEVVFNLSTKEFEYSAVIPPEMDALIEHLKEELQVYERGVRNSRNKRTADS